MGGSPMMNAPAGTICIRGQISQSWKLLASVAPASILRMKIEHAAVILAAARHDRTADDFSSSPTTTHNAQSH